MKLLKVKISIDKKDISFYEVGQVCLQFLALKTTMY
jgi:hypothetical protein